MITLARARLLNTLVAILGAAAFALAERAPVLVLAALGAGIVAQVMLRGGTAAALPRWVLNLLVLIATGRTILQVMGGGAEVISQLTEFIVWVLVIKLLDRKVMRDEGQLLSLSAFAVIGAVLTSNNLPLGVTLLVYTPLVILALVTLQLGIGAERAARAAGTLEPRGARAAGRFTPGTLTLASAGPARRGALAIAGISTLLSIGLALAAFIFTPRGLMRDALGTWGSFDAGRQIGFSESIKLGESGLLQNSSQPVMEVQLTDAAGGAIPPERQQTLYLRGAVLDHYDPEHRTWESSAERDLTPARHAQELQRFIQVHANREVDVGAGGGGHMTVTQRVSVRSAGDGQVPLFSIYRPTSVTLDRMSTIDVATRTGLLIRSGAPGALNYTVVSNADFTLGTTRGGGMAPEDPGASEPGSAGGAAERPAPAASVPRSFDNPFAEGPIRELAVSILNRAGVSVDPAQRAAGDARRAAQALTAYLRDNFTYSLEMVAAPPDVEPIEMFLFTTKQGHCEYFASALAAMSLSIGIPAQVVTGYAGGEYNTMGEHFTIRRSDAHAWVEIMLNEGRWETFDPTPPSELPHERRAGGGLIAWIRQAYEAMEFSWIENVVSFDQSRAASPDDARGKSWDSALRGAAESFFRSLRDRIPERGLARTLSIAMGVAIAAIVAAGLAVGVRRLGALIRARLAAWRRRGGAGNPGNVTPQTRFYHQLLALLAEAGFAKAPSTTPLAFAAEVGASVPAIAPGVRGLIERYYALRFGAEAPAPAHDAEVGTALATIRANLDAVKAARAGERTFSGG
ncbi:hypothetical protein BH11PLA1_BH11PLA1_09470 [soil metagenome]